MSLNYAFGFSLFLLILVGLNIYFFYTLNTVGLAATNFNVPSIKLDLSPSIIKDIYEYLNYLPYQYKTKNPKFALMQKELLKSFNSSKTNYTKNVWNSWTSGESLFPYQDGATGQILEAMRTSQIVLVDNAPKGTQLKLLLLLQDQKKIYFKPKRYDLNHVITGNIYAGFDRHNSEVFAYYLAMVLNFTWIPPSVIRRIHFHRHIMPVATPGLKRSMIKNGSGSICIYGTCYYCRINETVCPDARGEIEGAAVLYLDKQFRIHKSPWKRSYNSRKMDWENDDHFCKKVINTISMKRLLNLINVSIFDFLIQNGDRHHYEVFKDKVVLLDNGKGLGNPSIDELDILAPLYQCCLLSSTTWKHLETLTGGSLTETIKLLSSMQGETLATENHFKAVERRLLKVYATIQYCIGKHGSAKVFKNLNT